MSECGSIPHLDTQVKATTSKGGEYVFIRYRHYVGVDSGARI